MKRLTLHKHTLTHTQCKRYAQIKGNEIWRTMKKTNANSPSLSLLLSCSLSQKTHPHMTHLCLLTKLRKINTTENTNNPTQANSVLSGR